MSLLFVLGSSGCTTANEVDTAALGGALGQLNLAAIAAPTLPPNALPPNALPPGVTPQLQLCKSRPDVAVESVSAPSSAPGWLRVCTTVKNRGGAAWSSNASQVMVQASAGRESVSGTGFSGLAAGSTVQRCGWLKLPGLLRLGHDAKPAANVCNASVNVTSQLVFDPDILLDGNSANDDCLSTNNKRTVSINYVFSGSCPI
jgi:hypothetical protein